jgi:hypothetical protein
MRITGQEDMLKTVADQVVKSLEPHFELIEVTEPKPILNDDVNLKVYITVR